MARRTAPLRATYLLTMWQEQSQAPGQPAVWRFSLEDSRTGQRQGFATLQKLITALEALIAQTGPDEPGQSSSPARSPPDKPPP